MQIYNADQNKQIATILAIPDYRLKPSDKTVITFEEREANSPPAVKAWFYPGDNYGQEFVYPKAARRATGKGVNQPVPSMPANLEANTKMPAKSAKEPSVMALKKAPVKAEQPTGGEAEIGRSSKPRPNSSHKTDPPAIRHGDSYQSRRSELPLVAFLA